MISLVKARADSRIISVRPSNIDLTIDLKLIVDIGFSSP